MSRIKVPHDMQSCFTLETDTIEIDMLQPPGGGESRQPTPSGIKALMLAVFEDGIRAFSSPIAHHRNQAEVWVFGRRTRSPFDFEILCDLLGLDAGAVRARLRQRALKRAPLAFVRRRSRPNVRRTVELGMSMPAHRRRRAKFMQRRRPRA